MNRTTVVNIRKTKRYDIYCGRPGDWGNPYKLGRDGNRESVIRKFRRHLARMVESGRTTPEELAALSGKRLGCYCVPEPCHALSIAEAADTARQSLERGMTRQQTAANIKNALLQEPEIRQAA